MRRHPYLVLALLWAVYFHPLLLNPGQVLYADYSDFLAEHLPAKLFLNREWRDAGELPLWNPYHFCGTPFVHDIQVGAFYPPYAVTYLVPEAAVGAALCWVVALHVLAAGVFTLLYARSHGLGELGCLVAAAGFMLSAKWMTHLLLAGHTITVGLAWLPLVLLGLERGIRGGVWPVVGAGIALALLVLGTHPQWTFYAALFAALWTFPVADRARRGVLRWLACGLGAGAVAALLCAVQLLPTIEAAGQSARTGGVEATGSLGLALPTFLGLVGPSLMNDPPRSWEVRGVFGACWLAAALAAPVLVGGRARYQLGVFLGLLFFSVGGAALVEWLPGFNLFRVPGRMLLVATFPLAFLAGVTSDALVRAKWDAPSAAVFRRYLSLVTVVGVIPAGLAAVLGWWNANGSYWPAGGLGWLGTLVAVPLGALCCRWGAVPWAAVLLIELLAPTAFIPEVRPQDGIYPTGDAVEYLAENAKPGQARVLGDDNREQALLGIGAPLALIHRIETPRGYNPLDVRHYREFLAFAAGDTDPVRGNSPFAQQVLPPFSVSREFLNLMNVRYLPAPAPPPSPAAVYPPPVPDARPLLTDPAPPAVPPLEPLAARVLPPHIVYENPGAFPRAWVVPEAAPTPTGGELAALQRCDFRKTVLLATAAVPAGASGPVATARVTGYRPNRVVIDLDGGSGGVLVLADVWFPGWVCRVDGAEVPVYRANHTFRAVALPAGAKQAVFSFEPRSYRVGWWVSAASLAVLLMASFVGCVQARAANRRRTDGKWVATEARLLSRRGAAADTPSRLPRESAC